MDLHHTPSSAPHCNAGRVSSDAPDPVPGSEALEAGITRLWGHINAATAHFLSLVAEFDRKQGWAQHGIASCAHWLSWQCGIGRVAAREKVRVARALESLPKIQAAFGEGGLSYSKVRAITRWASEETEDTLLGIASSGTAAHVERTVRGFRRVKRHLERDEAEAVYEGRYLDCRRQSGGCVTVEARLTPEVGEMLLKALKAADAQLEEKGGDASAETSCLRSTQRQGQEAAPEGASAEASGMQSRRRRCNAGPQGVSAETHP